MWILGEKIRQWQQFFHLLKCVSKKLVMMRATRMKNKSPGVSMLTLTLGSKHDFPCPLVSCALTTLEGQSAACFFQSHTDVENTLCL
jgi:hypothetical protein